MSERFRRTTATSAAVAIGMLLPCVALSAAPAPPAATAAPAVSAAPASAPGARTPDELNEVLVSAEKPTRKPSELISWIRRLLGEYTVEGKADTGGKGKAEERWSVTGKGTCIGFGIAPGVQCELNVRWPQVPGPHGPEVLSGVQDLTPAMVLYGMEPDDLGIRYLQVNAKGLAEGAVGTIIGDTATFRTACVNAPAGCQRVMRITSVSESKVVDMQIDTEVGGQLAARFNFKLRRVAAPQAEMAKDPPKPAAAAPAGGKAAEAKK